MQHNACKPSLLLTALSVLMSLAAPRLAQAQAPYSITDLGTLGGPDSYADGLNNSGVVVGDAYTSSTANDAFYWQNGAMVGLGLNSVDNLPVAFGINNAGPFQIVGTDYIGFGAGYAFFWQNGGITWLPTLGGTYNFAYKINDAGQVVGSAQNVNNNIHACLWFNSGQGFTSTDLGNLPGGSGSEARDINAYGYAVGYSNTSSGFNHAVYWNSTGIHDLGVLPGGNNSYCNGVAPGESVLFPVGQSETKDSNGNIVTHACVFSGDDLGTLGGTYSAANAVNDYFQIVGVSYVADRSESAFLDSYFGTVMYDLNTMIPSNSGWRLQNANAINARGQIAGYGTINGATHAFLLTPTYHLKSLTVQPTTVAGSLTATGTVTLDSPAPFDLLVYLGGSAGAFTDVVLIPAEEESQTFLIDTTAVSTTKTVTISASLYGTGKSATLTIRPTGVKSLSLNHSSIVGGGSVTGKVTLEAPADPGPITVSLSSSNPSAAAPTVSSINIPRGAFTGTFTINTSAITANTVVTISAAANGIAKTKTLKVTP